MVWSFVGLTMNISQFINWLVYKKKKIFIPKYLTRWYSLGMCDVCGEGNIIKCDIVVEYKSFRRAWEDKPTIGYVYRHKDWKDCTQNERVVTKNRLRYYQDIVEGKVIVFGHTMSKDLYEKINNVVLQVEIDRLQEKIEKLAKKLEA